MSIDFKIQNLCDHVINWERVSLSEDGTGIMPSYPVGALSSLILRINNIVVSDRYYGTYINKDDQVLSPKSIIKLKTPCQLYFPIVELKYNTIPNYCPKCSGTLYIDDIIYGPSKDVVVTKDELLLIQTLEKLIVSQLGSNKYYTWIGTTIHELVGQKMTDIDYFKTKIVEDVKKAVDDLKSIENLYVSTGRYVSPGELFGNLLGVDVTQQPDPTVIEVLVKFTAQSGKVMELQQIVELSQLRAR